MIRVDEEFRDLVPPLSDAERAGLEADIVRDGRATVALTVWGDVLLDGHNRFAICTAHALPFTTQAAPDWIATRDDAKLWILQTSLNRRNLDALTRIDLVRRMEPLLAARAKAKQAAQGECGAEGGRGRAKETLGKNSSQGFLSRAPVRLPHRTHLAPPVSPSHAPQAAAPSAAQDRSASTRQDCVC